MCRELTHSDRRLRDPDGWVAFLSHADAETLVVFVHGFKGGAVNTWQRFPDGAQTRDWWRTTDLLFVGYDSTRDNITAVATRLRKALPRFFPHLPDELLTVGGASVRAATGKPYQQLVLVGHSLGGVVVRRALCDAALEWSQQPDSAADLARPVLLDAEVRLFSPATAGFRAAGMLGMVLATSMSTVARVYLHRSSAFHDMHPESIILRDTRRRTERLVSELGDDVAALRAHILWASPDDVVITERYDTDYVDDAADGTSHRSVCKPRLSYAAPWEFVETSRVR